MTAGSLTNAGVVRKTNSPWERKKLSKPGHIQVPGAQDAHLNVQYYRLLSEYHGCAACGDTSLCTHS